MNYTLNDWRNSMASYQGKRLLCLPMRGFLLQIYTRKRISFEVYSDEGRYDRVYYLRWVYILIQVNIWKNLKKQTSKS